MSYRWMIALAIAALAAFGCLPTVGHASSSGKGSSTIRDVDCAMYDGYGNLFQTTGTTMVSADGLRAKLTCKETKVPTPYDTTIYYNFDNTGHGCQVIGLVTNDWQESVTAKGTASMTCNLVIQ